MKRVLRAILMFALALIPLSTSGQAKKSNVVHELMEKKLKNAQLVLEGIAMADFTKITRGADALIQASKAVEWMVIRSPKYKLHTNDFRRAAENLVEKAQAKNIDGAALAYVEMTLSCVRCHQYVRDTRDARLAPREGESLPAFGSR